LPRAAFISWRESKDGELKSAVVEVASQIQNKWTFDGNIWLIYDGKTWRVRPFSDAECYEQVKKGGPHYPK